MRDIPKRLTPLRYRQYTGRLRLSSYPADISLASHILSDSLRPNCRTQKACDGSFGLHSPRLLRGPAIMNTSLPHVLLTTPTQPTLPGRPCTTLGIDPASENRRLAPSFLPNIIGKLSNPGKESSLYLIFRQVRLSKIYILPLNRKLKWRW